MANVQIFPDPQRLAQAAADLFIRTAQEAIRDRGFMVTALAGGTTPNMLYALLASESIRDQVDWQYVHIFWGDERCVPPTHPDSNYARSNTTLLSKVGLLPENIHRIPAEKKPELAAEEYEETLLQFFSSLPTEDLRNQASFDLILLGMGDDGHTASIFPGTPAVNENTRWVTALYVDKLAAWRITLTPALINRARQVLFLVSGPGKRDALQHVLYGSYLPDRYPAQIVQPRSGAALWMVDEAAAALF